MGRKINIAAMALVGLGLSNAADAGISAIATITPQQLGPNLYQYSMTLTDTGTTAIGTYWFAWFPFYDLLDTAPSSFSSPAGWTGTNAPDFFGTASAQWVTTTDPLEPGKSLSGFNFQSSETPAQLAGSSDFGPPVERSYVYIGAPQTDPGFALSPTAVVPEPASFSLLALGTVGLLRRRRTR